MRWFRDHIRRGSWAALVALALNLGLSFGHVHAIASSDFQNRLSQQVTGFGSPEDGPTHPLSDQADLLCPICMAAGAIGHALASTPPALPLALAEVPANLTIEALLDVPQPPRAAFHSRGPPIS